ncbi:hypothetical protein PRBEI_2000574900 [Prionailurus iriomotensis]
MPFEQERRRNRSVVIATESTTSRRLLKGPRSKKEDTSLKMPEAAA